MEITSAPEIIEISDHPSRSFFFSSSLFFLPRASPPSLPSFFSSITFFSLVISGHILAISPRLRENTQAANSITIVDLGLIFSPQQFFVFFRTVVIRFWFLENNKEGENE